MLHKNRIRARRRAESRKRKRRPVPPRIHAGNPRRLFTDIGAVTRQELLAALGAREAILEEADRRASENASRLLGRRYR